MVKAHSLCGHFTYLQTMKGICTDWIKMKHAVWLGLKPQIGRPLSRIVVPLVYIFMPLMRQICVKHDLCFQILSCYKYHFIINSKISDPSIINKKSH
jgi:hypothetical protein